MQEEERKKIIQFEDALSDLVAECLDGVSEEAIREFYGYNPIGDMIKSFRKDWERLDRALRTLKVE